MVKRIHYCKCGQSIRKNKKTGEWKHYGYRRMHEPYSVYLKRTDHKVIVDHYTDWNE